MLINTINKIKDHNTHIKKQRAKFATAYFERYPDKLEQALKEEQEKQKQKLHDNLQKQTEELNKKNSTGQKRSMSLGIRNRTFKNNLTLGKDK